jgi:hypothetical protein
MVKLENGQKKKTSGTGKRAPQPRWHSSHAYIRNTSLEKSCQQALGQQFSVDIQPSKTLEYTDNGIESLEPNANSAKLAELASNPVTNTFCVPY